MNGSNWTLSGPELPSFPRNSIRNCLNSFKRYTILIILFLNYFFLEGFRCLGHILYVPYLYLKSLNLNHCPSFTINYLLRFVIWIFIFQNLLFKLYAEKMIIKHILQIETRKTFGKPYNLFLFEHARIYTNVDICKAWSNYK